MQKAEYFCLAFLLFVFNCFISKHTLYYRLNTKYSVGLVPPALLTTGSHGAVESQRLVVIGSPHFHCAKGGQVSVKVITSADVQFSSQNQVKCKKRSSRLQMLNFLPKIKRRAKKDHHVRRPLFEMKIPKIFV